MRRQRYNKKMRNEKLEMRNLLLRQKNMDYERLIMNFFVPLHAKWMPR